MTGEDWIIDVLVMSRLPRASAALLLALLPASASIIGAIVLAQTPGVQEVIDVLLVMLGIVVHKPAMAEAKKEAEALAQDAE